MDLPIIPVYRGDLNSSSSMAQNGFTISERSLEREPQDDIFRMESSVRTYCRDFPVTFTTALGSRLYDANGQSYIDFLAGAGALNYGHNPPEIVEAVVAYMRDNGITHSLDFHTRAKAEFMVALFEIILKPRGMDYKVAFTGPTGTNAVEIAIKFARKATGRETVVAFTNAFHGMSQGALALSGNRWKRLGAGISLSGCFRIPYDGYLGSEIDTAAFLETLLVDGGSGLDLPAAIILETIQAEGGMRCAADSWLQKIADISARYKIPLIVDDIQAGCGRAGTFFSFESAGIVPDIVCLSKSIGGMGMPIALTLVRPGLDVLEPGQHNGTFRGNNLAFVAGTAALRQWKKPSWTKQLENRVKALEVGLREISMRGSDYAASLLGRGMLRGLRWDDWSLAKKVSGEAFRLGLLTETSGFRGEVLKIIPPLTISTDELGEGLRLLGASVDKVLSREARTSPCPAVSHL